MRGGREGRTGRLGERHVGSTVKDGPVGVPREGVEVVSRSLVGRVNNGMVAPKGSVT